MAIRHDRVKLVTRLETVKSAVSFESMEMIITIVSISIRLVVIYRMPPSKKNKLKPGTFVTEFSEYLEKIIVSSSKSNSSWRLYH